MDSFRNFIAALNSQTKSMQVSIAAVTMIIGVLIATQLRVHQTATQALQSATEADLTGIVSSLNNEVNVLRAEESDLRLQLFKIERQSSASSEILKESSKNLDKLKIIAGMTKVSGPGTKILITDENISLNSYDIVDILTELRIGGAEAISINGIRIIASTGISQKDNTIYIDGKSISPPYEVIAVGEPEGLYGAIVIAGGIRDKLFSLPGVSFYITKDTDIKINKKSTKN